MFKLFANSGDPDQMSRSAASDLGLHCLQITLLGVSRLQWVIICLYKSTGRGIAFTTMLVSVLVKGFG